MSNGRQALLGFEYQATVNLDLILSLFQGSTQDAVVRPEGEDDLVLIQASESSIHYYQIKKPKEFESGKSKAEPWSLAEVTTRLLDGTVDRLRDNENRQTWILGDPLQSAVQRLLLVGAEAPTREPTGYFYALHVLAFGRSESLSSEKKHPFIGWKPRSCISIPSLVAAFRSYAARRKVSAGFLAEYEQKISEINSVLPSVLSRIEIRSCYGSENEIIDRIRMTLLSHYQLDL
jgi:hypothetical protein